MADFILYDFLKIEVPTDSVPELELGDTGADIRWNREEREARKREEAQQQREEEARMEQGRVEETHSQEEGVAEKWARTEKIDTEAGAEAGI